MCIRDRIHLAQFKGKVLLITFIYTRCPLPNFCPLVTRNFAQLNRDLDADPVAHAKTQLLSVSFDPDHDTPERLRSYGATYIGSDASNAFAHWDFAVPDKEVLPEMARFFNVGITTVSYTHLGDSCDGNWKPPPHADSAVSAPSDAISRTASVSQRRRRLPGTKNNPIRLSTGAASGQDELLAEAVSAAV